MEEAPIVFIDADEDDQSMFKKALMELEITHPVVVFSEGVAALEYLQTTNQLTFLVISEISMPGMNGLELREQIEKDPQMRKKSIPFVFLTYPVVDHLVEQAYELTIQGLFEKKINFAEWKQQLKAIIDYWTECQHPKRFAADQSLQ
ncbi:response regulator [Spirosoma sp.]|uniref:response regulator n=1 Tax=Spirosoma sp. TaxID=1899569 RepID=UPI003B3A7601